MPGNTSFKAIEQRQPPAGSPARYTRKDTEAIGDIVSDEQEAAVGMTLRR